MITQSKTKRKNNTRIKSDWYVIGSRYENGRDELWNFCNTPFNMSPPYIQGDEPFVDAMKDLYKPNLGRELGRDIICALDNIYEEEVVGQDKINLLVAIDKYHEDYLGEGFENYYSPYSQNEDIVVYNLLLKEELC